MGIAVMAIKVPQPTRLGKPILRSMNTSRPLGQVGLLLFAALLTSCTQNFFNERFSMSTSYYFPDGNLYAFASAAAEGKLEVMDQLLQRQKVEVDQRGREGLTALAWAVGAKSLVGVDWLLRHGAQTDRAFYGAMTALTVAVTLDEADIVARLLKAGADPNFEVEGNGSPLSKAVRYASAPVVNLLLEANARADGINGEEGRPLVYALSLNKYDNAVALLEHKADPRFLPNMELWITNWMDKMQGKYSGDPAFQKVHELLIKAGFKLKV